MTTFTDPQDVHNPATGDVAPASWGDAVRAAIMMIADPPRAKVMRTTNQSITNATETAISFGSESFDTDTMHDLVTNPSRLTIQSDGLYHIVGRAFFANNTTGFRLARIWKNGLAGTMLDQDYESDAGGASEVSLSLDVYEELVAGDYLEMFVYQTSGGALNALGSTSYPCHLEARWVGISA